MIRITDIKAPLDFTIEWVRGEIAARRLSVPEDTLVSVRLLRKSLDARRRTNIHYVLTVGVEIADEAGILARCKDASVSAAPEQPFRVLPEWSTAQSPVIVGAGPAGLFAALTLAKAGARPLVLERGGPVEERRAAVERFWAGGELDPECNVQFGEGGAGTFSDGKLTTGISDPRVDEVLRAFCECGAPEEILYEARPHIGTDLLGSVVRKLREKIRTLGGRVEFYAKFIDFRMEQGRVSHAVYERGGETITVPTEHIILATGHSARDVFAHLHGKGVSMQQKPFAVGLRIEHKQAMIDRAMYGDAAELGVLPAADYKLAVRTASGRGVYTFCMCPGGVVVAASSEPGGVVTNGMSYHARDAENANSAVLVGVGGPDFGSAHPLAGVAFQREIEARAFAMSGQYLAPSCTVGEFQSGRVGGAFSDVRPSYQPGVTSALPGAYLPSFVTEAILEGLPMLGKKLRGFDDPGAALTGPETRTSSPVRILRGEDGCSISVPGLYPAGEGAGYAGGIVSAAVDGIKTAERMLG
ncbi:MAG: FAD-dependent oxidoreductase [Oscillospiraceae bacterium]|nr:FAD-dependent oxidoreductase [Oscillospiraceae bacterium]